MEKRKIGFAALTPEQRKEMGRRGGLIISQDKAHMSKISKLGHAARIMAKKEKT